MALHKKEDLKALRRKAVAYWRIRGLTCRAIAEKLPIGVPKDDIPPVTNKGKPFTFACVATDLKALNEEWSKDAAASIDAHKADEFAVIEDARSLATQIADPKDRLHAILATVDRKAKLMGLNSPDKQAHTFDGQGVSVLSDAALIALATKQGVDIPETVSKVLNTPESEIKP